MIFIAGTTDISSDHGFCLFDYRLVAVGKMFFGTILSLSEAETIFFASESGFSFMEKIVGGLPTVFV